LQQLSPKKLFARLVKKIVTLSLVSVCHFFDQLLHTEGSIRNLAIMFYILYESIQIVITASSLGIPVPQVLVDLLDTLKNKFKRKP
jgi:toxin secretion/phage lysis holin